MRLLATDFHVIVADENQIEVSFSKTFDGRDDDSLPLNVDKRYVLQAGRSGFYTYAIFDHPQGWPDLNIVQARISLNLKARLFNFMAISDHIQRPMPTPADRVYGSQPLAYKEAALLTHPSNPTFKGEVDDKYQYSLENKDIKVHGWICPHPHIGFWVITGSSEFRSGGPIKQDLTSHVGPVALSMFFSNHYAGKVHTVKLRNGEAWKKVFGPVFIYLNSHSGKNRHRPQSLWENAKETMLLETKSWPYNFPMSRDYLKGDQRGSIVGRLLVHADRYISREIMAAKSAYVGLAPPGKAGSWQRDVKGYQFWTQTNKTGDFKILAVRPGNYNLYAWVPGILGDYKYNTSINITPGDNIKLRLVFYPPRNGPTLWEIGIPDRKASEFFVPDPNPRLVNKVFINRTADKFRQYGLWNRYAHYYPKQDLVYTVGKSNYTRDWFFAHVNRRVGRKNVFESTTWRILFSVHNVNQTGTYTLRIALAASTYADVLVWINNRDKRRPDFIINWLGADNAIARHGIHGLYSEHSFTFFGSQLVNGENTIYLKQPRNGSSFMGVMYDYIRLEGDRTGTRKNI
ncbi:PREDICTED: probable rhamnogalacturonate lyase B [Ipomoea nil]|uniref:probable rhamnogalacturonate lyase B n=1 Tax=Ipomoea nil TaxID=35883 RepID=UPI000900F250|nr:PREDICTED: probable rhamnogalacturonate lyase B [Ipomoea nil]